MSTNAANPPEYMQPYLKALARHGASLKSLLWASDATQAARFDALQRALVSGWRSEGMKGRTLLDVGCGRGDLLLWLARQKLAPSEYIGLDAAEGLLASAKDRCKKVTPVPRFILADIVVRPQALFTGSEVVAVSGTLNTLSREMFAAVLGRLVDAAAEVLVFNFLSSAERSAASHLNWYPPDQVRHIVGANGGAVVAELSDYLDGDTTMAVVRIDR